MNYLHILIVLCVHKLITIVAKISIVFNFFRIVGSVMISIYWWINEGGGITHGIVIRIRIPRYSWWPWRKFPGGTFQWLHGGMTVVVKSMIVVMSMSKWAWETLVTCLRFQWYLRAALNSDFFEKSDPVPPDFPFWRLQSQYLFHRCIVQQVDVRSDNWHIMRFMEDWQKYGGARDQSTMMEMLQLIQYLSHIEPNSSTVYWIPTGLNSWHKPASMVLHGQSTKIVPAMRQGFK